MRGTWRSGQAPASGDGRTGETLWWILVCLLSMTRPPLERRAYHGWKP